jgi:uncharacterized protein
MHFEMLPGHEHIRQGLEDLGRGIGSVPALLVSIGAPRLKQLGFPVPDQVPSAPEHRLYELLRREDGDGAHSSYSALIGRLVSFERAAEVVVSMREAAADLVAQRALAVVGVSRSRGKFGNVVYRDLKKKGYRVFPVNPAVDEVEGDRCFPNVAALPESVGGVVIVVPPERTAQVVREAAAAGIRRIWMQQGAESEEAIRFCVDNGISVVHGHCIMMFAEPVQSFHRFHRWLWNLIGKYPR